MNELMEAVWSCTSICARTQGIRNYELGIVYVFGVRRGSERALGIDALSVENCSICFTKLGEQVR